VSRGGEVEYLIVAGGGAGGSAGSSIGAAGGGAGGLLTGTTTVTSQAYTITVGSGGSSVSGGDVVGNKGNNSSAFGFTAIGGGGGAGNGAQNFTIMAGGSGGGGRESDGAAGSGTAGQGNDGAAGSEAGNYAGGGGGAGTAGSQWRPGIGLNVNITGISTFYAGGGAANEPGSIITPGGLGGGGASGGNGNGQTGVQNTGGGGGGSKSNINSGAGGSGIVVIRYPLQSEPDVVEPKVAGDGLVLDLDFAKPRVYLGSGTVVNDSRLNGISGTLINSPVSIDTRTHHSGIRMPDNGTGYISLPASTLNGLTSWTIDFWLQRNITNGLDTFLTCGAGNDFLWYFRNSQTDITFENTAVTTLNYPVTNGVPFNFTATGSSGSISVYRNGSLQGTMNNNTTITVLSTIGIILGQEMDSQSGTFDSNQSWKGDYYSVKFYNRVLSATEITNNFNATRWRFGV
jgi:hypothetical protein